MNWDSILRFLDLVALRGSRRDWHLVTTKVLREKVNWQKPLLVMEKQAWLLDTALPMAATRAAAVAMVMASA